jgi:HAMP domain-containing protein
MGSIAMAAAIWGPIFWVGRYKITPEILSRAIILLWGFHTLSSFVGVLQVYDPERFSPDATFIETLLGEYAEGLKVTLDDGRRIYRPFGLTDSPGGASASGAFAATMGLILAVSKRTMPLRLAGAGSTALGMFCIYICQFRSALIVTCLGFIFMTVLTALRGQGAKAARLSGVIVLAVGAGFLWAVAVGGEAVTNRLETLTNNDTGTVLYKSRGIFLESTFEEEIPTYPLGAGLGRWGMMYTYFGDSNNLDSPAIWVEIQATAWILDGGLMLFLVGYAAVIAACYMAVQMAVRTPSESLSDNAAAIAAMNVGTLVATFGYPVFISQGGIMFWFLNALLYTAVATYKPTALPRSKK